jgi:cytosine deaminase
MGLEGYGLSKGCHADFVILDATSTVEAVRLRAPRLAVVRRGRVVSRGAPGRCELSLPGRPSFVDFRLSETPPFAGA